MIYYKHFTIASFNKHDNPNLFARLFSAFKFTRPYFRGSKGCSPALAQGNSSHQCTSSLIRGCVRKHAQLMKVHKVRGASRMDAGLRIGVKVRPARAKTSSRAKVSREINKEKKREGEEEYRGIAEILILQTG